jgi:hypothetical protein
MIAALHCVVFFAICPLWSYVSGVYWKFNAAGVAVAGIVRFGI